MINKTLILSIFILFVLFSKTFAEELKKVGKFKYVLHNPYLFYKRQKKIKEMRDYL